MIKNSQPPRRVHISSNSANTDNSKRRTMSELSQATSCERSNLFFIKSKHAFREFRNHEYFESRQNKETIAQLHSTQFVQSPAPFGVNNAYQYMCDEISKNYLRKKTKQTTNIPSQAKQAIKRHRRTVNITLPNLNQLAHSSKIIQGERPSKKMERQQDQFSSMDLPLQSNLENGKLHSGLPLSREYFISLIYISKFQSQERMGSLQVKVNIFPYLMRTFLKAKINYFEITNGQFQFIVNKIVEVYQQDQSIVSLPDVVNCKYAREVFQLIQRYSQYPQQQNQIVRHFFIANDEVYKYQFSCIKDQIKYKINLQANCLNNNENIYVFSKAGTVVNNLHQLLKCNNDKFIVGVDQHAYTLYKAVCKERNSRKQAADRLKKWKSIVPNQGQSSIDFNQITDRKYQDLFQKIQKKRHCLPYSKKKPNHFIKNPIFIERQKLVKSESIFQ